MKEQVSVFVPTVVFNCHDSHYTFVTVASLAWQATVLYRESVFQLVTLYSKNQKNVKYLSPSSLMCTGLPDQDKVTR